MNGILFLIAIPRGSLLDLHLEFKHNVTYSFTCFIYDLTFMFACLGQVDR